MSPAQPTLTHLPEDWERGLAIVAHPDDLEYGAASAIARWTAQGKAISYCLLTSGEAGIDGLEPDQARTLREAEQRASAAHVGVHTVEFLGFPDGVLEYGLPLRRAVARAVRAHRPQILITTNFRDTWGGVALNQADHIATGRAVLDGVRDAGNRWVFRDLLEENLPPHNEVRQVWAANSPQSGHGVDVTDTLERGVASLQAHAAYIAGLGQADFDPAEFLEGMTRAAGTQLGCRFAVPFEVFPFQ